MASLPTKRNDGVLREDAIASARDRNRAYCLLPDRNPEHSCGPIDIRQLPATGRRVTRLASPFRYSAWDRVI